ncbi:hypothetical protein D3C85_777600 [compost metagenome]
MQLYSFFNSSTSYRVRIALALKGLVADYHGVNLRAGEQRGAQGWQAGPRLLLAPALDLDLVLGRQLDAGRDRWLVTGATLRF